MRLAILSILFLVPASRAGQRVFSNAHDHAHAEATTTIDILSSSANHSIFLHLLQRTKLVPTLNMIQGSSVFAPTDDAWRDWGEAQAEGVRALVMQDGEEAEAGVTDNILFGLRQHLLYHILNYTLPDGSNGSRVTTETTLLFPNRPIMPPSPHKPPTGSPWLPQGGDGDLGGTGQQLRVRYIEGLPSGVGCDADGDGGAEVWDGWPVKRPGRRPKDGKDGAAVVGKTDGIVRYASNGVVIGLQRVMEPPRSIGEPDSFRFDVPYLIPFSTNHHRSSGAFIPLRAPRRRRIPPRDIRNQHPLPRPFPPPNILRTDKRRISPAVRSARVKVPRV